MFADEGDNCTETNCTVPECAAQTADDLKIRGVKRYTAVCKPPNECIGGKCTEPERYGAIPPQLSQDHVCEHEYPQPSEQPGRRPNPLQGYEQPSCRHTPPQIYVQ